MNENNKKVRILCLVKSSIKQQITEDETLMCTDFPSIWLEYVNLIGTKFLIGGFYREWTKDGVSTEAEQVKRIEIFAQQMEAANEKCKKVIILGDANVCSEKWADPFKKKNNVAEILMNKVEECGMVNLELGVTFTSDIVQKSGKIATSALDHIYISSVLKSEVRFKKITNSSTDHVPIKASLTNPKKLLQKMKTITKRSTKFFTKARWTASLATQRWENLGETEDLDQMVTLLTNHVTNSLDDCAPRRTFKVRNNYKFGISDATKALIKERDNARIDIKTKSPSEKIVQQAVYKKLRNRVIVS